MKLNIGNKIYNTNCCCHTRKIRVTEEQLSPKVTIKKIEQLCHQKHNKTGYFLIVAVQKIIDDNILSSYSWIQDIEDDELKLFLQLPDYKKIKIKQPKPPKPPKEPKPPKQPKPQTPKPPKEPKQPYDRKSYLKEYREKHKEELKQKAKLRYQNNKDTLKEKALNYYRTHKEKVDQYNKKYYLEHKTQILQKAKNDYKQKNQSDYGKKNQQTKIH